MKNLWQKFQKLLKIKPEEQQVQQTCNICVTLFLDDNSILHVNNNEIKMYDSKDIKVPHSVVQFKKPNIFNKQILSGRHISGSQLIAIIQVDLKMLIINYAQGTVVKSIKNVNYINKLSDQCLILFGINQIRTICKRTFKTINQVQTQLSSPIFTADVHKNLIVVGSYWDVYLFDYQLQIKTQELRAHQMNVLSVKFINSQTIATTCEDYKLILWQITTQQQDGTDTYILTKKMTISLSYINGVNMIVCPFNKYSLLVHSNQSIMYILFNQILKEETDINYEQLRCKQFKVQMDEIFSSTESSSIKQLRIDLNNNKMIATFKESCKLHTSVFNKNIFEQLTFN